MIKVTYEVFGSSYYISKALKELRQVPVLGFDTETRGVFLPEERNAAQKLLKNEHLAQNIRKPALMVAANNGLSFPSLVRVTHFVFGLSESHSHIMICEDPYQEYLVWRWLAGYQGKLLIHNTLFDLKIMYHRVQSLPVDYEDTALAAKVLINHCDTWRAKIGLKELMADYYDPAWAMLDDYEPENLREPKFLKYASIDGAAVFKLWEEIQMHFADGKNNEQ